MYKNYKGIIFVDKESFNTLCSKQKLAEFFTTENRGEYVYGLKQSIIFGIVEGTSSIDAFIKNMSEDVYKGQGTLITDEQSYYCVIFEFTLPEGHVKQSFGECGIKRLFLDKDKALHADNIENVHFQKLEFKKLHSCDMVIDSVKEKNFTPMFSEEKPKKPMCSNKKYDYRLLRFYQDVVINTNCNQANTSNLSDNGDENKGNGEDETSGNDCSKSDKIIKRKSVLM